MDARIDIEQGFSYNDCSIEVEPNNMGFKMLISLGMKRRVVFFNPAGKITHIRNASDPELADGPAKVEQPAIV